MLVPDRDRPRAWSETTPGRRPRSRRRLEPVWPGFRTRRSSSPCHASKRPWAPWGHGLRARYDRIPLKFMKVIVRELKPFANSVGHELTGGIVGGRPVLAPDPPVPSEPPVPSAPPVPPVPPVPPPPVPPPPVPPPPVPRSATRSAATSATASSPSTTGSTGSTPAVRSAAADAAVHPGATAAASRSARSTRSAPAAPAARTACAVHSSSAIDSAGAAAAGDRAAAPVSDRAAGVAENATRASLACPASSARSTTGPRVRVGAASDVRKRDGEQADAEQERRAHHYLQGTARWRRTVEIMGAHRSARTLFRLAIRATRTAIGSRAAVSTKLSSVDVTRGSGLHARWTWSRGGSSIRR